MLKCYNIIMILTTNKKAYFDYEVLETFEAGIVLAGPEVKSTKYGKINLTGGYVMIDNQGVLQLINVHISPYPPAFNVQQNYNPTRTRKLLIKKKEITSLIGKMKMKGVTIIPLKVFTKGGIIKIECGLVRGKKQWDKREAIKEREVKKGIKQNLKHLNIGDCHLIKKVYTVIVILIDLYKNLQLIYNQI